MNKTRVGKIARLNYETREQLNRRLLNGELGAPLLKWLNDLPHTIETLAELFAGNPITKQNLSEWRHGGYEDWLHHQYRQENFQHTIEQGEELEANEGSTDLFENFVRLVLAEMAEDLNSLHLLADREKRWIRLREISRDLARLQHTYNHGKKVELSYMKWNENPGCQEQISEETVPEAPCPAPKLDVVAPGPIESNQKKLSGVAPSFRTIYTRRCGYGCLCKDCHSDDGPYPYAQAAKDYENHRDHDYCHQQNAIIAITECDCYCGCPKSVAWEQQTSHPGSAGL
jgi:hypothetical protein